MSCLTGYFAYPQAWGFPCLAETLVLSEDKGGVAALMPTGMTTTLGQEILDRALIDAIFTEDIRILGEAISHAKEILLANGQDFSETSETFLLFGDPATELKVPLPRRPTGLLAQTTDQGILIGWNPTLDCNREPVSGYNLYRSSTPGGPYTQINTAPITTTTTIDTTPPDGTSYYVLTSVDSDGLESVSSQQASATLASKTGGCFIRAARGHAGVARGR